MPVEFKPVTGCALRMGLPTGWLFTRVREFKIPAAMVVSTPSQNAQFGHFRDPRMGPAVWAGRSIGLRAAAQNRAMRLTSRGVEFYRVAEGALDRAQVVPDMLSDLFRGNHGPGAETRGARHAQSR